MTDWNLVFYSLIYTSVPTIVVGVLDKDLGQKSLLRYPTLYNACQKDLGYSKSLFWAVMMDTIWQSLVLFYVPFCTYRHTQVDIYGLGTLWTIGVVVLVNVHLAMDIQAWTWIHHIGIWGSIIATWICMLVMDSLSSVDDLIPHYWYGQHDLYLLLSRANKLTIVLCGLDVPYALSCNIFSQLQGCYLFFLISCLSNLNIL